MLGVNKSTCNRILWLQAKEICLHYLEQKKKKSLYSPSLEKDTRPFENRGVILSTSLIPVTGQLPSYLSASLDPSASLPVGTKMATHGNL